MAVNSLGFVFVQALRFGEDDEESFRDLRSRERREVVLHDFGEEYSSKTDIEGEILQQRLLMVNWMVEVRRLSWPPRFPRYSWFINFQLHPNLIRDHPFSVA